MQLIDERGDVWADRRANSRTGRIKPRLRQITAQNYSYPNEPLKLWLLIALGEQKVTNNNKEGV
jgi:hypothetical protein